MSDDWVEKYIGEHNQKREVQRHEEQEAQKRRGYAEAGADGKFHQIRERVAQDIQKLSGVSTFQSVWFQGDLLREFRVNSRGDPQAELKASLNGVMIRCDYKLFPKEDPKKPQLKREPKLLSTTLSICSDSDSNLTVRENGNGRTFAYESDMSEFILMPLLTYITSQ
jgi:hypothetical protein